VALKHRDRIRVAGYEFLFQLGTPARAWLTSFVVELVHRIRAKRTFQLLPSLAEALEKAGCDDALFLEHCRTVKAGWRVS
jgi:hypothetical protein